MSLERDNTARILPWDGRPTEKCDHIGCSSAPVIHFELSANKQWAAECDLCGEHLHEIAEQAEAFVAAVGVIEPTELGLNLRAALEEHGQ